jgi:hypothetical protein
MKSSAIAIIIAMACVFFGQTGQAQYRGPRNYFPKSYPAPQPGGGSSPSAPANPQPANPQTAKPQPPKFKDVTVDSGFYFVSDTNRMYLWTKTSATTAKNSKNGVVQTISGETPIQR